MRTSYPNLELIDYIARQHVAADPAYQTACEAKDKRYFPAPEFDIFVFPQVWGSTCTGFDIMPDGSPALSGSAMTKEYTTVAHEPVTDTYFVFFGNRVCYRVDHATEAFYADLKTHRMASLSEAKERY